MWAECQARRRTLRQTLERVEQCNEVHIDSLDAELKVIAKIGILYRKQQLLREVIDRIVVNPDGNILRVELLPPSSDFRDMTLRVKDGQGMNSAEENKNRR